MTEAAETVSDEIQLRSKFLKHDLPKFDLLQLCLVQGASESCRRRRGFTAAAPPVPGRPTPPAACQQVRAGWRGDIQVDCPQR